MPPGTYIPRNDANRSLSSICVPLSPSPCTQNQLKPKKESDHQHKSTPPLPYQQNNMAMQHVSLVGTRTIGRPDPPKDYIELKHVTMVGTRIIRIPKRNDDPTSKTEKKESVPEQAPPVRRRGWFGRRRR